MPTPPTLTSIPPCHAVSSTARPAARSVKQMTRLTLMWWPRSQPIPKADILIIKRDRESPMCYVSTEFIERLLGLANGGSR